MNDYSIQFRIDFHFENTEKQSMLPFSILTFSQFVNFTLIFKALDSEQKRLTENETG